MNLNTLAREAFYIARDHGFHPDSIVASAGDCRDISYMATRIALTHSELSEALEELRIKPLSRSSFGEELADVIIRVADLAHIAGVDLEREVENKMWKNKGREYQHGGKAL